MQGDCLELMREIQDGSVDMVLCDLPYGVTACAWDRSIPIEPLWEQYHRLCKANAVFVLFGTEPFASRVRMSNLQEYKYDWIWHKNKKTCFVHAKNRPMADNEVIMVFSPGSMGHASLLGEKRMPYNPQGLKICNVRRKKSRNKFGSIVGARPSQLENTVQKLTGYPSTTLEFRAVKNNERTHPTQKPVALLEYLIRTYTNEGETVLDNCMGSGSTGVAALNTGRRFIGIELDEGYFRTATERIAEAGAPDNSTLNFQHS